MGQVLLLLVVALTVAAVVFGVTVLVTGRDPGLVPVEPDGQSVPLPPSRPLRESDVGEVRFDTALRGYRMAQVDQALRRAAYDIGYKSELIGVLEAEVAALREGRAAEAEALRRTREQALTQAAGTDIPAGTDITAAPAPGEATVVPASGETAAGSAVTVPAPGETAADVAPGTGSTDRAGGRAAPSESA